jgi:hypothetical protein
VNICSLTAAVAAAVVTAAIVVGATTCCGCSMIYNQYCHLLMLIFAAVAIAHRQQHQLL